METSLFPFFFIVLRQKKDIPRRVYLFSYVIMEQLPFSSSSDERED